MATRKRTWDERTYQTTWEDLEPWLQQLYEDHRVVCDFSVVILPSSYAVRPAVVVEAYRINGLGLREELKRDYKLITLRAVGLVEREALQMVSLLLLELENDKASTEAKQASFWGLSA